MANVSLNNSMDAESAGQGRRQRLYRLSAIVLRRRDMGEADRLLTVFGRAQGKLTLLAKGVRRQASRKAGHLEPFTYTELLVAKGKSLDLITQAETIEPHRHVREDLWRSSWAYYVVELADAFTQEADPNDLLFDLLLETLRRLDDLTADPAIAIRYYELHLLALAGFQPQLFRCVQCSELLKPEVNFMSLDSGGCLCPRHGANRSDTIALSLPLLKVLRYLQSRDWTEVALLRLSPDVSRQLESLLGKYIVWHLERSLRSPAFLEKLRKTVGAMPVVDAAAGVAATVAETPPEPMPDQAE
jgi:DNA repair protein RecO (recombination protein O)